MRYDFYHSSPVIIAVFNTDLRIIAFTMAALIYAAFGSPTPDVISWVEFVIGALIVFAVGTAGFMHVLEGARGRDDWFFAGQIFLIYGFTIGLSGAFIKGTDVIAVIRDILPFGFMFLPLFLIRFYETLLSVGALKFIAVFVGLCFALRAASPELGLPFDVGYEALYYLANSPLVLFSALFLLGFGMERLSCGIGIHSLTIAMACFLLFLLAVFPVVLTSQRASLAAIVVYGLVVFVLTFIKAPRRMIFVGCLAMLMIFTLFVAHIGEIFQGLMAKSDLVGANMRFEEWMAVWQAISGSPLSILFGQGWGASFSSPAVADIDVTFTHGLLSSMLLKLGLVGFLICAAYVGALFLVLLNSFKASPVLALAIMAPFLIDVFLYAAFKSLDFGLLLALIPVVMVLDSRRHVIETQTPVLYEGK